MLQQELKAPAALALGCLVALLGFYFGAFFAASASRCDPLPDWLIELDQTDKRAAMDYYIGNIHCTGSDFLNPGALLSFSIGGIGFASWSYGLFKMQPG